MRPRASRLAGSAAALLLALSAFVTAQSDRQAEPPDEGRLLNTALPDVTLTRADGAHVRLSEVGRGRPLLLAFVFTRCGGVCSPFLRSWRAADSAVSRLTAFHRLVLSFDSRDSATDMAALAEHVGAERDGDWTFAVAAPADVRRLADATGFWYDWNEASQQFDHPAMVAGIRDGRLVRLLVGGVVSSRRLDELVREVSGEFVASYPLPSRRIRFRCLQFDESTGRVTLDWGFVFLLVPIVSTGLTTLVMFAAGAQARRRASAVRHNPGSFEP